MMAYGASEHETTGQTPNSLMLSRELSTPLNIMYEMPPSVKDIPAHKWAWDLKEKLENSHRFFRVDYLENVALGKESRQDSTYKNTPLKFGPHLANDGKTDTTGVLNGILQGQCSHTLLDSSVFWWAVNLEVETVIERITIYGRTDCCNDRLRDFDVLVYNPTNASWNNYDKGPSILCHHQTGESPLILNVTCEDGQIKGRFVKIIMRKNHDIISHSLCLCEVEVYGRTKSGEPECPCSCDYKQNVESIAEQVSPQHSEEEWREILQQRLTELQNEMKLDKRNLSRWRRNYISAADKRETARNIGIVGVLVLCAVVGTVVLLDLLSLQKHIRQIKRLRRQ
ncbi:unnamed protein product [Mytilus coruscus]|uniref:Fucolectin tachylectin-4 pentraxin-1 domain-containing protein n=1 Tax=Mytilus coruscus TaxID=42192 RepID=A0A6J8EH53_MYTCO|nr:unnamed protein product [Mytilus coruscus]